jgi:hypothetical protein
VEELQLGRARRELEEGEGGAERAATLTGHHFDGKLLSHVGAGAGRAKWDQRSESCSHGVTSNWGI